MEKLRKLSNNYHQIQGAVGKYPRGCWKISRLFALSQKLLNIYKNSFTSFSNSPSTAIHFCHLCIPSANNEVDLLLRYQFTAEIKAALFSYLFPVSLFPVLETNKSHWEARSWIRWDNNCHLKDMQALKNLFCNFEKCGKVFHPLKAGILLQISVPPV